MADATLSIVNTINRVVEQAQEKYNIYIKSDYIAANIKIDGVATRGQYKDSNYETTTKEEYTKMMTCMLDVKVKRGSTVEMQANRQDDKLSMKGIVITIPIETPVDHVFNTLFYNTVVQRKREAPMYSDDGDVISNSPIIVDDIECFVQRVGMRERQIDAGIDRNSVNQLITSKNWDIQIDDLLYVGDDKYKVTDIEELDDEVLSLYMTYYRG
ncbi:MAG: hypothetical protein M0P10_06465 [Sphaerochaetaceae bacterium]|nr:hypothetical protein [Sphaerochaetaceae bacterium]